MPKLSLNAKQDNQIRCGFDDPYCNFIAKLEGCASISKTKNLICRDFGSSSKTTILYPYKCSAGVWTIGFGETLMFKNLSQDQIKNTTITIDQAYDMLSKTVKILRIEVCHVLQSHGLSLNQSQEIALISFCYNCGIGAFKNSTLLSVIAKDLNNKDAITQEFLKWQYAGGNISKGLVERRKAEINKFFQN